MRVRERERDYEPVESPKDCAKQLRSTISEVSTRDWANEFRALPYHLVIGALADLDHVGKCAPSKVLFFRFLRVLLYKQEGNTDEVRLLPRRLEPDAGAPACITSRMVERRERVGAKWHSSDLLHKGRQGWS